MQQNLRLRSQVAMAMREFLVHKHGIGFSLTESYTIIKCLSMMLLTKNV